MKDNEYINESVNYSDISSTLSGLDGIYDDEYKAEFDELVKKVSEKS